MYFRSNYGVSGVCAQQIVRRKLEISHVRRFHGHAASKAEDREYHRKHFSPRTFHASDRSSTDRPSRSSTDRSSKSFIYYIFICHLDHLQTYHLL